MIAILYFFFFCVFKVTKLQQKTQLAILLGEVFLVADFKTRYSFYIFVGVKIRATASKFILEVLCRFFKRFLVLLGMTHNF
jgi:hypothetical protein